MLELVESWLQVKASKRAATVSAWLAAQTDVRAAARGLAEALELLDTVPMRQDGSHAPTALFFWLEAEGIRHPLDEAAEAAEAAGDREIAAQLWTHASNSALMLGELADLPYEYARRAILTGSLDPRVWEAFESSMISYCTGFFEDIEGWQRQVKAGELAAETVARALAAAQHCARDWEEDDRERLALVEG
jgi:hypothetical protein